MIELKYAKVLIFLLLILTGCGQTRKETDFDAASEIEIAVMSESEARTELETTVLSEVDTSKFELQSSGEADSEISSLDSAGMADSESLLDAFLANQIPAVYEDGQKAFMFEDFQYDDEDWDVYSVGERVDLDNDGEKEQIINGPYGGKYLDARNHKIYVLAEGEGTSRELSYVYYDNAVWIVHSDITHAGRQMFWLTRYDGEGKIADEIQLSAEYWESSDYQYHENSDFTFGNDKISMEEYEKLRKELFGW